MKLQFLGAAETTSGSCYLLSFNDYQVLIDCGLFQGPEELKQRNYGDFPFIPGEIDAVILTHAHIDHSGLLPKLVKHGFKGPIYATGVTADLCSIMLKDSAYIQETEVERKNRKLLRRGQKPLTPIYTVADAEKTMNHFRHMVYDEEVTILPNLRLRLRDAGHILGAAIVELWMTEGDQTTKFVFSGDLGNLKQPIVQDPTFISAADVVIIESTYGTRLHEDRDVRFNRLAQVVNETMERGGNLLIPAFALGRTQDLLYALRVLQDQGDIPRLKVFIDSPLAVAATEVFQKHAQVFDFETRTMLREGRSPFQFPGLQYTESVQESMALNSIRGGAVIIAASGMADAGRIKHHLRHNLWREEATVLLVGYQAQGTLGRMLQDGATQVRIHGEPVAVKAQIETITGFSAHGDQEALLNWLSRFRHLGKVFVTHGEAESSHSFAKIIREQFRVPVVVPKLDETFDLSRPEVISAWETDYEDFYVEENFSGVVQVVEERNIKFRGCYGLAERKYGVKNTQFTAFNLGSGREFFARVALYRLWDQGLLEAPYPLEMVGASWEETLTQVTGKDATEVVTEQVLVPLDMNQTAYYFLDQLPVEAAVGYTKTRSGQNVENIYAILAEGLAPQLFSNLHDLNRFWSVLVEGEFLRPSTVQALLAPYAVGEAEGFYQIMGSAPGASMIMGGSLERGALITVLSNGEEGTLSVYNQLVDLSL